jgi:cell division protein FtsZ
MSTKFDSHNPPLQNAVIKVIGVGGGGGNTLEHMLTQDIPGVEFICANTDAQALKNSSANCLLQLGQQITKGLGAGANPEIGRLAAEADRERVRAALEGADMVFITAGMGGGTGTGAAPVIAEITKQMKILTVAVVTKPFEIEGKKRLRLAEEGIKQLSQHVDSLITIPNEKLMNVLGDDVSLLDAFKAVDDVSFGAVKGIAALITRAGLINVDFADVKTVMSEMGTTMIGTGVGLGSDRALSAANAAIGSPLLKDINLKGARGVLVNITAGPDLSMKEFGIVGGVIKEIASKDANVVIGTVIDAGMNDELRVTVVITGLGDHPPIGAALHEGEDSGLIRAADGSLDYHQLERPTVLRKQGVITSSKSTVDSTATDIEYFDIPAFLRRQEEVS